MAPSGESATAVTFFVCASTSSRTYRFKNNHFTKMCCGTEAGSYLRRIDFCITQLKAQGPSRTCNESKEEVPTEGGPHIGPLMCVVLMNSFSVQYTDIVLADCWTGFLVDISVHPGGNPGANLKSISHRCHLFEVAFLWELTKETIHLPLGCLQGEMCT